MNKIVKYLLKKVVQWLSGVKGGEFKDIVDEVVSIAKTDKRGYEKAEAVIQYANKTYVKKQYQWVSKLLVEAAYIIAEDKGLLKDVD